ncbi:MAG: hypothetical protein OXT09_06455, partial [Myxococcales bacterium]|nr:hypothetical protein [Myxococcales bacterium]
MDRIWRSIIPDRRLELVALCGLFGRAEHCLGPRRGKALPDDAPLQSERTSVVTRLVAPSHLIVPLAKGLVELGDASVLGLEVLDGLLVRDPLTGPECDQASLAGELTPSVASLPTSRVIRGSDGVG